MRAEPAHRLVDKNNTADTCAISLAIGKLKEEQPGTRRYLESDKRRERVPLLASVVNISNQQGSLLRHGGGAQRRGVGDIAGQ